jgi:hypothetical protein
MQSNIKNISPDELAILGLANFAYVRAHEDGFSIHAADGTEIALANDFGTALSAIVAHDLLPISVH